MIFAPRSCPSRPGFATTTRIFRLLDRGAGGYQPIRPAGRGRARGRGAAPRSRAGASARRGPASAPGVGARVRQGRAVVASEPPRRRRCRRSRRSSARASRASVCAACTTTVPFMNGCGVQMYANVPASSKVCERLCPFGKMPVSKLPSLAVAECGVGPLLVQVTVSPWLIVIVRRAEVEVGDRDGAAGGRDGLRLGLLGLFVRDRAAAPARRPARARAPPGRSGGGRGRRGLRRRRRGLRGGRRIRGRRRRRGLGRSGIRGAVSSCASSELGSTSARPARRSL